MRNKDSSGVIIANVNTQVTNCNIGGNNKHSIWFLGTDNTYIMRTNYMLIAKIKKK
ncbi:MAG: hypothetical protein E6936_15080 [Clostridium perfringens]|nr:hypothetical protein [Clostridium perfringens]